MCVNASHMCVGLCVPGGLTSPANAVAGSVKGISVGFRQSGAGCFIAWEGSRDSSEWLRVSLASLVSYDSGQTPGGSIHSSRVGCSL